ncbi:vacuolar protein sorting-associated protein 64 [Nannizzia gypsea CBS 118893]|uniref:Vacuolar protein sorting-associated protein 64 n=1 Tax=Arthroderma gypseum (strain ATCC MYA-4604 / CBS 118893) TaxID=535722 RepID=E5R072_ARTGP|nr:vacuolar protein sorting-associated protein 64 [Nannizzia gypsea CBS 118893]EFQ97483.1 vacuolar protein sorting-associated protein 64 [Nannizzia gypsea CBS 118893]
MTAVASPPSVQSAPRLGWYPTGDGGQGALTSMSADEVSRMLMPRKSVQRSNSSSSLSSNSSNSSTSTVTSQLPIQPQSNGVSVPAQGPGADSSNATTRKKPSRYTWSSSKADPVSGVTNTRPQTVSVPPSGVSASSAMSALHQTPPMVPLQHIMPPQQNGIRPGNRPPHEPAVVLSLLPINGTFERKQINVPYFPEVLRIGRQTNAKTLPTPANGYFDSKVLSRQHAEVWSDRAGKIWIRDVKSSNGTFVNGQRLSPENRDSEPHELREHDVLELGIDIISEDQKSIVHHKVSAKVEHAGIHGPNMNILDLNFGDIDPTTGGGLLPHHLSQPLSHMRGRAGSASSTASAASVRSGQSMPGSHANLLHQQRQMNYWSSPISIEQVVKKLTCEMKQAKQLNHDLGQTSGFLSTISNPETTNKERASLLNNVAESSPVGTKPPVRPKLNKTDSMSRFSDPPAPPPQQPLPEKPDGPPRTFSTDSLPKMSLRRNDTEKAKAATDITPAQSSQILSLIEALTTTKKELDLQASKVKELENMLRREQSARESAEERARKLESQPPSQELLPNGTHPGPDEQADVDLGVVDEEGKTPNDSTAEFPEGKDLKPTTNTEIADVAPTIEPDPSSDELKRRIDTLLAEMETAKKQMNEYRESAERAEKEAAESRQTLAEMIEKIRQEKAQEATAAASKGSLRSRDALETEAAVVTAASPSDESAGSSSSANLEQVIESCRSINPEKIKELEAAATAFAKQKRQDSVLLEQSAPYASMLGVVLIGVGIMAYLNGWHKVER